MCAEIMLIGHAIDLHVCARYVLFCFYEMLASWESVETGVFICNEVLNPQVGFH